MKRLVFVLAMVVPLSASAVEFNGEDYGDILDDGGLGLICRSVEENGADRLALSHAVEGAPVSASFVATRYSPTHGYLEGTSSVRQGAYFGEYVLVIDVTGASIPEQMQKGDRVRVYGMLSASDFFSQAFEDCFVSIKATAIVPDGF